MSTDNHRHQERRKLWSRSDIVLVGFLLITGFYLLAEHRAHLFGALPWLILLACPLLHMFMHGGHGGHGSHSDDDCGKAGG